nr:MAG TPA: hypothetical protein [Caudoviricetes sp.]
MNCQIQECRGTFYKKYLKPFRKIRINSCKIKRKSVF